MQELIDQPKDTTLAKKALLAVNFFVETNRMEPFVAVYYITFKGWSEVRIGMISLVMNAVTIVFQTPAGDLLDKTCYKRSVTCAAILVASVTTACVAWTDNFWIVLTAKSIEGVASTIFLPALMALLLGICLSEKEVPSFIAKNEVSNKTGSVLFTLGCGLISYFLFPNIASMFYLLGAGGLLAAFFVTQIPHSAIDSSRARKLQLKEPPVDNDDKECDSSMDSTATHIFYTSSYTANESSLLDGRSTDSESDSSRSLESNLLEGILQLLGASSKDILTQHEETPDDGSQPKFATDFDDNKDTRQGG